MVLLSESNIRKNLTIENYNRFLRTSFYSKMKEGDDWDNETGTCGAHASFVIEQLGFKSKDFSDYNIVTINTIDNIIKNLNKGYLIDLYHNYKDKLIFSRLPKDNRYGNHQFQIIKGGDKYFVTQGFLHAYKHSLIAYSEEDIRVMLNDIITKLSDYENKKKWSDLDLDLYKKYLRTDLFMYPKRRVIPNRLVHNVVLRVDVYKSKVKNDTTKD